MNTTTAQSARQRVAAFIYGRGLHGATDEEIADGLKMRSNTARPRRIELATKTKEIKARGKRETRSGGQATVWVHRDFVIENLIPEGEGAAA